MTGDPLDVRPARPEDRRAVLALLAASLGRDDDPRFEELFAWKHEDNAFGASPAWVAHDGDRIVGYRAMMRWRFERSGRSVEAVRAVDTATDPAYQGRGIFTRLTMGAVDALRDDGVRFVFNTPNEQSRPGYLKMGWREVGRLPVAMRPLSLSAPVRIARARVPAERWSLPCTGGEPAVDLVGSADELGELLASQPQSARLRTARSPEYLAWRYGTKVGEYRGIVAPGGLKDGVLLFRVRRRGDAREVVLDELITRAADPAVARGLLRRLRRAVSADYVMRIGSAAVSRDGFVRLPRQGPILTWRALAEPDLPPLADWDVTLGDVELF